MTLDSPLQTSASPGTSGRGRAWWTGLADLLLASLRPYASPNRSLITPPGAPGGYGTAVDGLEGFARSLLIAGFRIAGERGRGMDEILDFYAGGIAAGVDPDLPDRWVRLDEHPQAKVEAASIALVLDLTRPWLWDGFDDRTRGLVVDYLAPVVGDHTYPRTNWLWFRVVVETFLRSVGGPWSPDDIAADLALHDSFERPDGWLADGAERSYDHYAGWALHLYPVLWSRMTGAADLAGDRVATDTARLDRFLLDALALIGGDGSPLLQGRSLTYRFAAAAPLWAGVLAGVPSTPPGALRHAAEQVVGHFLSHGAPDDSGLLPIGWHHGWRRLAQSYSGPGSPYWAAKGLLGVALPADHPVWTAPAEPLPVERGDVLRAVAAPGWLVSGTRADGIVRVSNHGTDHALPGSLVGDSPLYARLGYSTATSPLLDPTGWNQPVEQSVAVLDAAGRASHRAAVDLLATRVSDGVGVAGSRSAAHWVTPNPHQTGHGSGIEGAVSPVGDLTVWSLVRGAWEVRLARLADLAPALDPGTLGLRIGGWPLAGQDPSASASAGAAVVTAGPLTSRIVAVAGPGRGEVVTRADASPLGPVSAVPTLTFPVLVGEWVAALVELTGTPDGSGVPMVSLARSGEGLTVDVVWPDGPVTTTHLTDTPDAAAARR